AVAAVAAAVAATGLTGAGHRAAANLGGAQRATGSQFAATFGNVHALRVALGWDTGFVVAYVAFACLVFSLFRRTDRRGSYPLRAGAVAGIVLVVAGGVADLVENAFLGAALGHPTSASVRWQLGAMRGAGVVKWALLGAAVVAFV